jgi:hypothetical protein
MAPSKQPVKGKPIDHPPFNSEAGKALRDKLEGRR